MLGEKLVLDTANAIVWASEPADGRIVVLSSCALVVVKIGRATAGPSERIGRESVPDSFFCRLQLSETSSKNNGQS